jgi:uncharacterized damage-inducible protein DinB
MLAHPHRMAQFSAWASARVYDACAQLPPGDLSTDRGAFFRSILGTLNHLLLVDMLYRERLQKAPSSQFTGLDEILHDQLTPLRSAQDQLHAYYLDYTHDLEGERLDAPVGFETLLEEAEYWEVSHQIYFSNLFQHQIHHRGQIHNMLSQAGLNPPSIGFIEFEVELGERIVRRKAN